MELENRVASGRCVPATFGRACRYDYQEGPPGTRRRLSRQLDLRTTERQRQEVEDLEDNVVVRPRRCRAQARSRRARAASTGIQSGRFRAVVRHERPGSIARWTTLTSIGCSVLLLNHIFRVGDRLPALFDP